MPIHYGPRGGSFVVLHSGRVVSRYRTLEEARQGAERLARVFGGATQEFEAPPVRVRLLNVDVPDDFGEVLWLSIPQLRERLERGDLDEHLLALLTGESGGRARRGAIDALHDRARAVGRTLPDLPVTRTLP